MKPATFPPATPCRARQVMFRRRTRPCTGGWVHRWPAWMPRNIHGYSLIPVLGAIARAANRAVDICLCTFALSSIFIVGDNSSPNAKKTSDAFIKGATIPMPLDIRFPSG
jgi:hypothetical protein